MKPLIDQTVKEGKDKKVIFECIFSKPNGKPKWFLKKDVCFYSSISVLFNEQELHFLKINSQMFRNYSLGLAIK